ncbi:MAG: FAD-dependent thymidylate synthase [Candidatus Jorgensenbacteria bacterium]
MPKVFIYDEFAPQDIAMMQALYSRSPLSVEEHVKKVKQAGSGKFMEKFYVGFGHASIADCGSTTVFIEGISTLCDKAIQDWPLYAGQETSTRYIDMSKQPLVDPVGTADSKNILARWMAFYIESQEPMKQFIRVRYPRKEGEDEATYEHAVAARAFDTLRGFLPAGITTQLSWHTNLRQAHDKLCFLRKNPLPEVRETADMIFAKLKEKYPQSFSHETVPEQERYFEGVGARHYFYEPESPAREFSCRSAIDPAELARYWDIMDARPPKTVLPHFLAELGNIRFDFMLDFGSFRDIQRHRNGVCRMPLLTARWGFHPWYLGELPEDLRGKAEALIGEQKKAVENLKTAPAFAQYYLALGFLVPVRVAYGLPAAVYVAELRSGRMVHPTLRKIALRMCEELSKLFPFLTLHADTEPSDWDVRRGLHDIIEKKTAGD